MKLLLQSFSFLLFFAFIAAKVITPDYDNVPLANFNQTATNITSASDANSTVTEAFNATINPTTFAPTTLNNKTSVLSEADENRNQSIAATINPTTFAPTTLNNNTSVLSEADENRNQSIAAPKSETGGNSDAKVINSKCLKADELRKNIGKIIEAHIPKHVKLPKSEKGEQIPLILENGFINIGNTSMIGEPSCNEDSEGSQLYNFFLHLVNLNGAFEWKLFNLFNNNFSESVLITLNNFEAEFTFREKNTTDGNKLSLEAVKIGSIANLQTKVNLPEKVVEIKVENQDINYLKSRITTFVENHAKEVVDKELQNSISQAIKDNLSGKSVEKVDENLLRLLNSTASESSETTLSPPSLASNLTETIENKNETLTLSPTSLISNLAEITENKNGTLTTPLSTASTTTELNKLGNETTIFNSTLPTTQNS